MRQSKKHKFFQSAYYQFAMGNKNSQSLPSVITKNWSQLQENPDVYKSKLTSQCVREHTIKVLDFQNIEQFKLRMKQTNPYICRVAFYYHLSNDIYHVYTDQNRNKPFVHHLDEWKVHKQHIVQAFLYLSRKYGYMNVCNQMIGVDFNGQIKVWINPDSLSNSVWSACSSQTEMISDILTVCRFIDEESQNIRKKNSLLDMHPLSNKKLSNQIYLKNVNAKNNQQYYKPPVSIFTPKKLKHVSSMTKTDEKTEEQVKNINSILNNDGQNEQRIQIGLFHSTETQHVSNPQTPTQQQPMSWERTKTQNFAEVFQNKNKTRRCTWADNYTRPHPRFFRLQKQIKQQKQQLDIISLKNKSNLQQKLQGKKQGSYSQKNQKSQRVFQVGGSYGINSFEKTLSRQGKTQCSSKSTEKYIFEEKKKKSDRKCLSIEKRGQTQRLMHNCFQQKQKFIPLYQPSQSISSKLSSKLVNVANIPVKEERQSEATFMEIQDDVKGQQKLLMSISQQFINFFDEQEKRQYGEIRQKILMKSIIYEEFKNEVSNLLDDD